MKKILALVLILTTLAMTFIACNNDNTPSVNNTGTEATQPIGTTPPTVTTQPTETQVSTGTSTQENKGIIPEDPQKLMNIITQMGFEPQIQTFTREDSDMADNMGISLDAIDGLVLVGLFVPNSDDDFGPSDFLQFAFCTNLKNALELRSCLGPEELTESIIFQEGTIIATGTKYVWDAFVEFVTNHN